MIGHFTLHFSPCLRPFAKYTQRSASGRFHGWVAFLSVCPQCDVPASRGSGEEGVVVVLFCFLGLLMLTTVRDLIQEDLQSNPLVESVVTLLAEWFSHWE